MTRTAAIFPGQGSHRAGMASAWADHPAGDAITGFGRAAGLDLRALADDAQACGATAVGQPAIAAVSLAAWTAATAAGFSPDLVAGHSLGEVTAAIASGALGPADGARLIAFRGRAMGEACEARPGAMIAVLRLSDDQLDDVLRRCPGVSVANDNAAGQVVLAGPPDHVDAAAEVVREVGGRVLPLPVQGAFHTEAMRPAQDTLARAVDDVAFTDPAVPIVSGLDGTVVTTGSDMRDRIVEGITTPVRWRAVVERFAALEVTHVVELGPGGVLSGLVRRALPDVEITAVATPDDLSDLPTNLRSPA